MRTALVLAAVLLPSVAAAQPGVTPVTTAPAGPSAAPAPDGDAAAGEAVLEGIRRRVELDAASGRSYFTETALTPRAGKVTIAMRAPFLPVAEAQLRVALHDRLEVGIGGLTILEEDEEGVLSFHAKGQVWRNDRAAIAVGVQHHRLAAFFDDHGEHGDDGESITMPTAVASTCLDGPRCTALVSVMVNAVVLPDEDVVPIFLGFGWALGSTLQFVGEVNVSHDDDDGGETYMFGYTGLRGAGRRFAFDFGVGFAGEDDDTGAFPFLAATTRL